LNVCSTKTTNRSSTTVPPITQLSLLIKNCTASFCMPEMFSCAVCNYAASCKSQQQWQQRPQPGRQAVVVAPSTAQKREEDASRSYSMIFARGTECKV